MAGQLRFTVLGPLRCWSGDREVGLGTAQQRAVLGILLLRRGRMTDADSLVTAVWGEDPPAGAIANLRTYVSRLRRILGSDGSPAAIRIESRAGSYALPVPPGAVDLDHLEGHLRRARSARERGELAETAAALAAALELSTGVLLSGLAGPYIEAERESLDQVLLTARTERCEIDLDFGRPDETLAELQTLVAENPFHERLHELLMLSLYRSGRQSEALAAYDTVRRQLVDELGVEPGPGLQRMHQDILGHHRHLLASPEGSSPRAAVSQHRPRLRISSTAPNQLPADLPDFAGREKVLDGLVEALLAPDAVPVVALTGMGGVGKTALAVRAAHQVRESFPDGQLFVSLAALSEQPPTPHAALGHLLRSVLPGPDAVPATLAERVVRWRSTLAGRRILMILDDVVDHAQIQDLLPAMPGCAAIITARRQILGLPGAKCSTVEVFDLEEAVTLLSRIAGPERVASDPEAVERVAALCSHLPHALRYVGCRLLSRPRWSVAEVVDRIAEGLHELSAPSPERTALLEPIARGHALLDPVQTRTLRLLAGSEDESIQTAVAAARLGLSQDLTETVLESLADVHLIEAGRRGEYHWPELVRLFARREYFLEDQRVSWPLRPGRTGSRPDSTVSQLGAVFAGEQATVA